MNKCQKFASIVAKQHGMSYNKAIKKYPMAYQRNMVYLSDGGSTTESHCTHCARAEAIIGEVTK